MNEMIKLPGFDVCCNKAYLMGISRMAVSECGIGKHVVILHGPGQPPSWTACSNEHVSRDEATKALDSLCKLLTELGVIKMLNPPPTTVNHPTVLARVSGAERMTFVCEGTPALIDRLEETAEDYHRVSVEVLDMQVLSEGQAVERLDGILSKESVSVAIVTKGVPQRVIMPVVAFENILSNDNILSQGTVDDMFNAGIVDLSDQECDFRIGYGATRKGLDDLANSLQRWKQDKIVIGFLNGPEAWVRKTFAVQRRHIRKAVKEVGITNRLMVILDAGVIDTGKCDILIKEFTFESFMAGYRSWYKDNLWNTQ